VFDLTPRSDKPASEPPQDQPRDGQGALADGPSQDELRLALALDKVLTKKPSAHRHRNQLRTATHSRHTSVPAKGARQTPRAARSSSSSSKKTRQAEAIQVDVVSNQREAGFFWVATDPVENDAKSTSKSSLRWLKKARRENRRAQLRHVTQWLLLTCAACAVIALTLLPNAT